MLVVQKCFSKVDCKFNVFFACRPYMIIQYWKKKQYFFIHVNCARSLFESYEWGCAVTTLPCGEPSPIWFIVRHAIPSFKRENPLKLHRNKNQQTRKKHTWNSKNQFSHALNMRPLKAGNEMFMTRPYPSIWPLCTVCTPRVHLS